MYKIPTLVLLYLFLDSFPWIKYLMYAAIPLGLLNLIMIFVGRKKINEKLSKSISWQNFSSAHFASVRLKSCHKLCEGILYYTEISESHIIEARMEFEPVRFVLFQVSFRREIDDCK